MEKYGSSCDHIRSSRRYVKIENVIYKLTNEEDTFVIVQLVEPGKLGFHYTDEQGRKHLIALFKGLISARDDIYP